MTLDNYLRTAIEAAEEACKVILEVYHSNDFQAEAKGDNSPLTLADKKANAVIEVILDATHLPILSEEGKSIPYGSIFGLSIRLTARRSSSNEMGSLP